jgi:DNA-binding MarR family transcriptional regulator
MRGQFRGSSAAPSIVLENALAFWVNRFYEVSRRAMYREFRAYGVEVTPEQWLVLVRLWERDDRPQRELAAAIERDAPTTSRIVDAMERAKLVTRVPDPKDARGRRVRLSAKARGLRQVLVPVVKKLVAKMEHGVSERDLEITRQTLQRLTENLG